MKGIGLKVRHKLDKTTTATYEAQSVTSSVHKDEVSPVVVFYRQDHTRTDTLDLP